MRLSSKWVNHFRKEAELIGEMSKDSTKVGALLIGEGNEILLKSFNGPAAGVPDTPDIFERPRKYLFASHAEQNLIAFAAKNGIATRGKSLFCTHRPCNSCANTIAQSGIKNVVCLDYTSFVSDSKEAEEAVHHVFECVGITLTYVSKDGTYYEHGK